MRSDGTGSASAAAASLNGRAPPLNQGPIEPLLQFNRSLDFVASGRSPSPRLRAPLNILGAAGVAATVLAVVLIASTSETDHKFQRAIVQVLIVGTPVAAGLYATRTARTTRFGIMLIVSGLVWSLTALGESSESLPYSAARVSVWLSVPILAYLLLTVPDGRLGSGLDRKLLGPICALVALLFVGSALFVEEYPLHTPWASCQADCPPNAFLVLDHEPAVMGIVVGPAREMLGLLLFIGVTWSTATRWRAAGPLRRGTLDSVVVMSIISTVTLIAYVVVRWVAPGSDALEVLGSAWSLSLPGIAAAFLAGSVRRRLMVGHMLARLSMALSPQLDPGQLRTTLATTLDDPTLEILTPDGGSGRWRRSDGRMTSRSLAAASGHAVTPIGDDEPGIAALVHDPVLGEDSELLEAMRALVLSTLEHQQMASRLATLLTQLEDSRKRIARAADVERSRIERDLHDGAQQRLIALRIKLSLAEELAHRDPVAGIQAVHDLGVQLELTLDELRNLAQGVYPAILSDRGLRDAFRSVLVDSPLTGHLAARGVTRHPAEVETAVYFTCLEAMQNAIKHGRGATGLWVSLRQDDRLRFVVRDDGQGFELGTGASNGGMRNMRDRVEAVGGQLTVESTPGHGTRISGSVPLR
jgi:signal transduction histidine kinase